mmetsp:Transcript_3607/g.5217  ORF Transcript_3607/g.5217 Transcript_3607/m.5217 type:complete len:121 (+) Transcript_3607:811-1173(+)
MCVASREALRKIDDSSSQEMYITEKDVPGIGKCSMTERGRIGGIASYTQCIRRYALRGLLNWLQEMDACGHDIEVALRIQFYSPRIPKLRACYHFKKFLGHQCPGNKIILCQLGSIKNQF